ncbi:PQQ-dependent sugar dehydrogenase [Maricaulis sp.]|uniref:PQQ-dependent sugar dehydrogenase n=1 Tax=Maricaulis sp. TaxID=1486257 RepID=UPI0026033F1B|nr:PQQ-dependent sugar dehydrogenase [Maricaulis sp.]
MRRVLALSAAALVLGSAAHAQEVIESTQADFRVASVAEGLEFPWGMAFLPGGAMLVSEREGRLRYVDENGLREQEVSGLPDDLLVERQGGLLGLALHPQFEDNRLVYFAYSAGTPAANHTALGRGRLNEDATALTDVEELFQVNFDKERGFHFGGRIQFLTDGTLMLTLGDGGLHRNESQNLANHLGTLVRLNDDGSVPFDNPFVTSRGAQPEIFSYGHRNIQGIAINPDTGSVWTHEHGARGGDEINIVESGLNYGWPAVTYGINYNGSPISDATEGEGYEEPIWYWNPSIAPSGMAFYQGDAFPGWQGDVFVGALAGSMLVRYEVDGDRVIGEEQLLTEAGHRIRDVQTGPDGYIYILTDDLDGQVLRLEPATR